MPHGTTELLSTTRARCLDCGVELRPRECWPVDGGYVCEEHKINRLEASVANLEAVTRLMQYFDRR